MIPRDKRTCRYNGVLRLSEGVLMRKFAEKAGGRDCDRELVWESDFEIEFWGDTRIACLEEDATDTGAVTGLFTCVLIICLF